MNCVKSRFKELCKEQEKLKKKKNLYKNVCREVNKFKT